MRKVTIALEIKYGIVLNILHNAILVGESPYVEFDSLQEAMGYMFDNGLPFRGTKPAHEVINNVADLTAYAADNGIEVSGTLEEIRAQITAHNETEI